MLASIILKFPNENNYNTLILFALPKILETDNSALRQSIPAALYILLITSVPNDLYNYIYTEKKIV